MIRIGLEGKLYRNTGTYAAPVWEEITNVKDLTLAVETGRADVTTRANGGWRATKSTLKDGSIEFQMVWDPDDEGFAALRTAFFNNTSVEVFGSDGDMDTEAVEGLRATMAVVKFDRSEPLEEAMTASVSLKPTYAANAPAWVTVNGTSSRLEFDIALVAGAGEIDLTAIPYGEGTYDATGKKVVELRVSNAGANTLTITEAVANGYDLFALGDDVVVAAGGLVRLTGAAGVDVDATHRLLTLAGTLVQTSTWTIVVE